MAKSRISIAIFFKLLCILSLILAPKVASVYAPLCKQYKDIGECPDGDDDPLFPRCAEKCKKREGVETAICYIRAELEKLLKGVGRVISDDGNTSNDPDNTEVTNDSSAGVISDDGNNNDSVPDSDVQSPIPLKCFCCVIQ